MSAATANGSTDLRAGPHDLFAERATLGAMLLSSEVADSISEIVTAKDFYKPGHGTIFDTILGLSAAGHPTDPIAVAQTLTISGDLARIGGATYLSDLMGAVPIAANGDYYAQIVLDKSVRRRLAEAGTRIAQLGYNEGGGRTLQDVVALAEAALFEVTERRSSSDFSILSEMLQPTLDTIESAGSQDAFKYATPTGFLDLDRLTNGFLPGQLVVIAARPSVGKSTLAVDAVRHAAIRAGQASAVFSLEMSKPEIVTRILSAEARIPLHVLKSGQLSDDDWARLARRMGEIGDAPIFVDDSPSMTMNDIRAKARRLKAKQDLRLVVVDYLQLMTSAGPVESRQQEVSRFSRELKLLAKEIECPIIAVSQLNRGPEQRQDKRPQMSDLRESGAIEQDADIIILLHRDDYYDKESPRAGEADFIVAKNRNGAMDTITVASQLHFARFVDMAVD